ncbi:hypothetical protein TRICHSKD4_3053 [Roseibium sp. TrichSKD4]|nr:hypothetical protein TRICHSKD4_3053 [Roseibium sp. TrichSKD4]
MVSQMSVQTQKPAHVVGNSQVQAENTNGRHRAQVSQEQVPVSNKPTEKSAQVPSNTKPNPVLRLQSFAVNQIVELLERPEDVRELPLPPAFRREIERVARRNLMFDDVLDRAQRTSGPPIQRGLIPYRM